jgi:hypothetical protein
MKARRARQVRAVHYALYSVDEHRQCSHYSVFMSKDKAEGEARRLLNEGKAKEVYYYTCDCDEPDSHRLSSAEAMACAEARSRGDWANYNGPGKPITEEQLQALLAPFGIQRRTKRRPDGTIEKFYAREQFEEAWKALGLVKGKPS